MRVFLDIDIGDAAALATAEAAHGRTVAYLREKGNMLGLDPTAPLTSLDSDSRDLLAEAYAADPAWSAKGPCDLDAPAPLHAGRLVIELDPVATPRAAENFRLFCTGEKGVGKGSGKPLTYKGTPFHRIIKGFVAQGGDTVRGDGSGKESTFGAGTFPPEKKGLAKKHDAAGVVGMAGAAPACQFYITLGAAPQADGKHVVIGKVVEGLGVLERLEAEAASEGGEPRVAVAVGGCGVV